MLGFRGASRYISPEFYDCFELECARSSACATTWDDQRRGDDSVCAHGGRGGAGDRVAGEERARARHNGLRVIMMCEIPSNAVLADRFLEHFDGFSIGSNDMTQLTLAVDRDAGRRRSPRRSTSATTRSRRCWRWRSAPAARRGSTQGSAGRGRPTIPTSRSGWSSKGSRACRSIRNGRRDLARAGEAKPK